MRNSTQLLIKLYEEEDSKYNVTYKEGVLQNLSRPLNPINEVKEISAGDKGSSTSMADSAYFNLMRSKNAQRLKKLKSLKGKNIFLTPRIFQAQECPESKRGRFGGRSRGLPDQNFQREIPVIRPQRHNLLHPIQNRLREERAKP